MSKISELIGSVVDGTPVHNRTVDGEEFYTIIMSFHNTEIPVLYSEYVNHTQYETDTKLKVQGCLMSDIADGELPVFYFYANKIEVVAIDSKETNEINFSCTVNKVGDFKTNKHCVDFLSLTASDGSPLRTTSVLYLCAKGGLARKLRNRYKGYQIIGSGYLKQFRDVYEIYITSVENLAEILE